MKRALLALSGFLLLSGPLLGVRPLAAADEGAGVICYRGGEGYLLEVPPGWSNLRDKAAELGLCALLAPAGMDFADAPALLYPSMAAGGSAADQADLIDALLADSLARFRAAPGGAEVRISEGADVRLPNGLVFTLRYLDDGPAGNEFEAVAGHAGVDSIFLLTLSARTPAERLRYLSDFMRTLRGVEPYVVRGQP